MTIDTLEIAKRLKNAGFAEAQAEAITGVIRQTRDADMSKLATKDDLSGLEARFEAKIEILRRDLTIRLGGMIVVATGVLLAAKFFA